MGFIRIVKARKRHGAIFWGRSDNKKVQDGNVKAHHLELSTCNVCAHAYTCICTRKYMDRYKPKKNLGVIRGWALGTAGLPDDRQSLQLQLYSAVFGQGAVQPGLLRGSFSQVTILALYELRPMVPWCPPFRSRNKAQGT